MSSINSSINGVSGNSPVQKTANQPIQKQVPADPPAQISANGDRVELSGVNHLMQALKTNNIRTDKVADIKAQIDAGTYDADGSKLDGALNGLLDDLS